MWSHNACSALTRTRAGFEKKKKKKKPSPPSVSFGLCFVGLNRGQVFAAIMEELGFQVTSVLGNINHQYSSG